jgi:hypothetical protein
VVTGEENGDGLSNSREVTIVASTEALCWSKNTPIDSEPLNHPTAHRHPADAPNRVWFVFFIAPVQCSALRFPICKTSDNDQGDMGRKYYSIRKGRVLDLLRLKAVFKAIFDQFSEKQYFVEAFGFDCVDAGHIPGLTGGKPDLYFLRHLRRQQLWPLDPWLNRYTERLESNLLRESFPMQSEPEGETCFQYKMSLEGKAC